MSDVKGNKKMYKVTKETSTGKDIAWKNKSGETLTRKEAMNSSDRKLESVGLQKVSGSKNQSSYVRSVADSSKKNNLDYKKKSK